MSDRLALMSAKKKINTKRSKSKAAPGNRKRSSTKKPARKKPAARKKASPKKSTTNRNRSSSAGRLSRQRRGTGAARQSADLQGLSRREDVDSESVEELVEEGNIFEAGAVRGVEEADDREGKEVRTHEFPEDDVPGEYLDKD